MRSVRDWADGRGFEYRFLDDRLFDYLPSWYREQTFQTILPHTNLARLLVAKQLLADGHDRTVWVDADILVFDPELFDIEFDGDFAFCREVWIKVKWGAVIKLHQINNSVTQFKRGNRFLDYCIWAHEEIARHFVLRYGSATRLLSAMHQAAPLPTIGNVGLINPLLMLDLLDGGERFAREYVLAHGAPLRAANLCASLCDTDETGIRATPADYEAIVELLLDSRGSVLNGLLPPDGPR
ncbi:MAG: hypothetical protein M3R31_10745 [Pseudomonadota bacterium]|nr:hypothetical protein [Pseudomonadota bacterium]